ncbi:MAG TPA: pseudouridine synthase [Terrimicrobiaceae bacterium]|nr:pseudouridine synthase [Terrimicrobiaceae bacterium]
MRLNRFLAAAGFGSRRACEALIKEGKVSINGHFVRNLATVVGAGDDVRVAGSRPARRMPPVYIILHKPKGVVCSRSDERGRPTIFDLVPRHFGRLFHVGRLDKESEGLILLTNDGDLSQRLTHPAQHIEKEYEVLLDRPFDPNHVPRLLRGFRLESGPARADRIQVLAGAQLRVVLRQGMKRQIRVMFYKLGYEVKRLLRIRIGGLQLSKLAPGEWRALRAREIALLTAGDKKKS